MKFSIKILEDEIISYRIHKKWRPWTSEKRGWGFSKEAEEVIKFLKTLHDKEENDDYVLSNDERHELLSICNSYIDKNFSEENKTHPKAAWVMFNRIKPYLSRDISHEERDYYNIYKFKFKYTSSEVFERMQEEDKYAFKVLNNHEYNLIILQFSKELAKFLKKQSHQDPSRDGIILQRFLACANVAKGRYPIHYDISEIVTLNDLINILEESDDHLFLLSILWMLPIEIMRVYSIDTYKLLDIDGIYRDKIYKTKKLIEDAIFEIKILDPSSYSCLDIFSGQTKTISQPDGYYIFEDKKTLLLIKSGSYKVLIKEQESLPVFLANLPKVPIDKNTFLLSVESFYKLLSAFIKTFNYELIIKNEKMRNDFFGNSGIITTPIFNKFHPYLKCIAYIKMDQNTDEKAVNKYVKNKLPYISGASGMANAASSIFQLLQLDIHSEDSRKYMESICAFIVGSGMHSYTEVYKSMNLSMKYVYARFFW